MTLTELSVYTRRMMPIGIIFLLIAMIGYFSFQLLFIYLDTQLANRNQNSAVVTNPVFGPIKAPNFGEATVSGQFTYILDTIDGTTTIQEATPAAHVFFLPQSPSRFGFLQRIYFMAKAAGFDTELVKHKLSDKQATFSDGVREMMIDINSFNFNFQYTLTKSDPILQQAYIIDSPTQIQDSAADFLRAVDRYPEELAQGRKNIIYLRYDPDTNQISTVSTAAEANLVEVDFYRPDIDNFPVASSTYFNSPHYVVMTFNGNEAKIIRAQVTLHEKSTEQIGSYNIRPASEAWKDLQEGRGFVVASSHPGKEVKIKKILIAYLDPQDYQEYLQPIYVFLGENNFVAYTPAVVEGLLSK